MPRNLTDEQWEWIWNTLGRGLVPPTPPPLSAFLDALTEWWRPFGWTGTSPWDPEPPIIPLNARYPWSTNKAST